MKMISGYLEPGSGRIEIDGMDIARHRTEVQRRIGYLPETLPIYPEMTVADYLDYAARLKGLPASSLRSEIRRVVGVTADKLLRRSGGDEHSSTGGSQHSRHTGAAQPGQAMQAAAG